MDLAKQKKITLIVSISFIRIILLFHNLTKLFVIILTVNENFTIFLIPSSFNP